MTIAMMRNKVKNSKYKSDSWNARVDAMHDNQVIAVYYRLMYQESLTKQVQPVDDAEQMCFSFLKKI